MIDYSLEQPKGGVQFVIPPGNSPDAIHLFTYGWENSSRLVSHYFCVSSCLLPQATLLIECSSVLQDLGLTKPSCSLATGGAWLREFGVCFHTFTRLPLVTGWLHVLIISWSSFRPGQAIVSSMLLGPAIVSSMLSLAGCGSHVWTLTQSPVTGPSALLSLQT